MNYTFIKNILTSVWFIDAITMQQYSPILHGILSGNEFEREGPNDEFKPNTIKCNDESTSTERIINVQPIKGVMMRDDGVCGTIGTRTIANNLLVADKQQNIIGHILVIDSGGGQANAVPELADAIKSLTKPIIAYVDGFMCSAAMYVGSYCDKIIASRASDSIGSIGTLIELAGFPKYNKNADGYTTVRVYADESTEKNEEFEQAIDGNMKLIKERILNPHNQQFIADIKANRPNVREEELHGRRFAASEVVGTLIDSIGSMQNAVEEILNSNKNNQNISNQNLIKMENTPLVMSVLAVNELAFVDGNTSLNEEQVNAIETALAAGNAAQKELADLKEQLKTAKETLTQRETRLAELEKNAGAESVQAVKETDENDSSKKVIVNPMTEFANNLNEVKKYL